MPDFDELDSARPEPSLCSRLLVPGDLETRSDGRTIYGRAVPFDQETTVNDGYGPYQEVFRKGAFTRTINNNTNRVKLLINHDRQRLPIGRALNLEERRDGLYGEFRVSNTPEGDQALELVRDGVLDAFSIGFAPIPDKSRKGKSGLVERLEVKLREVSVVAFPAYEGALIGGVRHDNPDLLRQFLELGRAIGIDFNAPLTELAGYGTSDNGPGETNDDSHVPVTRRVPKHHRENRLRAVNAILNKETRK